MLPMCQIMVSCRFFFASSGSDTHTVGVEEVADSAISLLLNLMRKTHELANGAAAGTWPTQEAKGSTRYDGHPRSSDT